MLEHHELFCWVLREHGALDNIRPTMWGMRIRLVQQYHKCPFLPGFLDVPDWLGSVVRADKHF